MTITREASELGLPPGKFPESIRVMSTVADDGPAGVTRDFARDLVEYRHDDLVAVHYRAPDGVVLIVVND